MIVSAIATGGDLVDDSKVDLTVDSIQLNGTRNKVDIRLDALPDEKREIVQSTRQGPGRTLRPTLFSEQGQPDGPQRAVGTHCAGTVAEKH